MKVLFISRSTLFSQPGGDTLQVEQTAKYLRETGIEVDIVLSGNPINVQDYDLVHFFNIIRPADLDINIPANIPLVVSSIYHDYSEYDSKYRSGASSMLFRLFGKFGLEYIKVIVRWLNGSDKFPGWNYILKGHKRSMLEILWRTKHVFTTSHQEADLIEKETGYIPNYSKVSLGSEHISVSESYDARDGVLCAARIEGFKNQLNLIKALKGTYIKLKLTGSPATNQKDYFDVCKATAGSNVQFLGRVSKDDLEKEFSQAKVHALISFYETTGLSTLEALKAGCQVVITDRGAQPEIFGDHAFYCEPTDVNSIRTAIEKALKSEEVHSDWVIENFSWAKAAKDISDIYRSLIYSHKQ